MARKLRLLSGASETPAPEAVRDDARAARRRWRVALVLGSLLCCVLILLSGELAASAVRRELDRRLVLAGAGANAGLVEIESEQLSLLRAILFTSGVAPALAAEDANALNRLVTPLQANSAVPMVDMVRTDGQVVFAVRAKGAPPPVASRKGLRALSESLAQQHSARRGRFSTVVSLQGAPILLTIGPVTEGTRAVGLALVMTPLADVLGRLASQVGAALSAYSTGGTLEATTASTNPPPVDPAVLSTVRSTNTASLRELPGERREADGGLVVDHSVGAVLGVSSADDSADAAIVVDLAAAGAVVVALGIAALWCWGRRRMRAASTAP